jgi:hypothetical protein
VGKVKSLNKFSSSISPTDPGKLKLWGDQWNWKLSQVNRISGPTHKKHSFGLSIHTWATVISKYASQFLHSSRHQTLSNSPTQIGKFDPVYLFVACVIQIYISILKLNPRGISVRIHHARVISVTLIMWNHSMREIAKLLPHTFPCAMTTTCGPEMGTGVTRSVPGLSQSLKCWSRYSKYLFVGGGVSGLLTPENSHIESGRLLHCYIQKHGAVFRKRGWTDLHGPLEKSWNGDLVRKKSGTLSKFLPGF